MSDTKTFASREETRRSFVALEHGFAIITLSLFYNNGKAVRHPLTAEEARDLASDLARRADLLDKPKEAADDDIPF